VEEIEAMPTIEIISLHSTGLNLNQAEFEFAIIEENKPESHRGLFNNLLKNQSGVIIHVGNPEFKEDKGGGFFGGKIITELNSTGFQFVEEYKHGIDTLFKTAIEKSPIKRAYFLTDYQFGPENGNIEIISSINDFWARHNVEGLMFNTLYELNR
jgi:hypothetical protein